MISTSAQRPEVFSQKKRSRSDFSVRQVSFFLSVPSSSSYSKTSYTFQMLTCYLFPFLPFPFFLFLFSFFFYHWSYLNNSFSIKNIPLYLFSLHLCILHRDICIYMLFSRASEIILNGEIIRNESYKKKKSDENVFLTKKIFQICKMTWVVMDQITFTRGLHRKPIKFTEI